MNRECIVFPTARNIRHALSENNDSFLPHYMTMGDFLSRVQWVENQVIPDDDLRVIAMHEASRFDRFAALQIERNFFTFIQNSQYLFRFFEELGAEMVEIDALECADTYGEYEEHIAILKELRAQYAVINEAKGWMDPIFMSKKGKINHDFLNQHESITLHIEGYLTRHELGILLECSQYCEIRCDYTATAYNQKMSSRFEESGIALEINHRYLFSLRTNEILKKEKIGHHGEIRCEIFQSRLVQAGFVKNSIEEMVRSGIEPEKIAVILPDESFARYLRILDTEKNFNFAMGRSLGEMKVVTDIEAVELFIEEPSAENKARISSISSGLMEWLKNHYYQPFSGELLDTLVDMMVQNSEEEVIRLIREEHYAFGQLYPAFESMDFKAGLRIFMNRIKKGTVDDVQGGKITVMGLLETRGTTFDGVIVVDFNESVVPHRSQKDMFLNTKIREIAGLPTSYDRESLQKHYYTMLFNRAKKVAISCVKNSESVPSRFLMQLGIEANPARYRYEEVLFPPPIHRLRVSHEYQSRYDFTEFPLSASRLKTFLTCKRQFYYKYILKVKEHEIPRDMSEEREIGNEIHRVLEEIYREKTHYATSIEMKSRVQKIWEITEPKDALERHMRGYWLEKMTPFFEREVGRAEQGYRVAYREKECEIMVEGIRLVGRIDRIDKTPDGWQVIDYKTGKYPATESAPKESDTDYQLSIYALIASELGNIHGCAFYDLNTGELKFEQFLDPKIESLRGILRDMAATKEWEWNMCEDLTSCRYCTYAHLCNREL